MHNSIVTGERIPRYGPAVTNSTSAVPSNISVPASLSTSLGWDVDYAKKSARIAPVKRVHSCTYQLQTVRPDGSPYTRVINEYRVCDDPMVIELDDFVTDEEINELLTLTQGRWEPSKTSIGKINSSEAAYSVKQSPSRTSFTARLLGGETPTLARIEQRVASFLKVPLEHLEGMNILRYHPGQQFKVHHDGDFRMYSMLIYLSDVEEGGETEFSVLNLRVKPKRGKAVYWKNCLPDGTADQRTLHAALPPIKGVKYCVPIFVNKEIKRVK